MLRRSQPIRIINKLGSDVFSKGRGFLGNLWNKPLTRDEQVKDYVPEVLEEALAEQRAVLAESTSRDVIVELGHKILKEIENKAATPSIAPHLAKIMSQYGGKDLISQRALSYLLYPSSSVTHQQPHDLVVNFHENFQKLIETVEREGSSSTPAPGKEASTSSVNSTAKDAAADNTQQSSPSEHSDIPLFAKVTAGMAMANVQCNDNKSALNCCDVALLHTKDATRKGGLLAMKAGILNRLGKFDDAAQAAKLAIEASNNPQGYIQGAAALKRLNKPEEVIGLLEKGHESHPENDVLNAQLEDVKKHQKIALVA